ncbi:MFS transporter [Aquicoccus sp. SCR17]|nr:MFS transporter [Carideicomes alvinocaridis]
MIWPGRRQARARRPVAAASPWLVLAIVSSALFLIVIDMTILYTALPRLTRDLGASSAEKLWIVNAYSLVVAGLLPGAGALGDRYGHRRLFLWGLLIFALASLVAGFAPTAEVLIGSRALLALGAAAMMPTTLSLIRQSFDDPEARALAIGIWASIASGGAAIGPLLGGVLLEHFHWGSVFLVNLPVVALTLPLALRYVPRGEAEEGEGHPFDPLGSLQVLAGLIGLTLAIKEMAKPAPSLAWVLVPGLVGAAALWLFLRRQRRSVAPMLDLALFRDRRFSAAVIGAVAAAAALLGIELVVSQRLQLVEALSPMQAGLAILPLPLGAFVAGPLAGLALSRTGASRMLMWSLALVAAGALLYRADLGGAAEGPGALRLGSFIAMGAGLGAAMTAASTAIMQHAPAARAGMAASVEEVSYELGGALGIALLGSVMSAAYTAAVLGAPGTLPAGAADSLDRARVLAEALPAERGEDLLRVAMAAFDRSVSLVMLVAAGILGGAALWILQLSRRGAGPQRSH